LSLSSEALQTAEVKIAFDGGVFIAVRAVHGILADAGGVQLAHGTFGGLGRVGGTDQLAEVFHGVVLLQDGGHNGARRHEFDQFPVEGARAVHGVELTGLLGAHPRVFHRADAETGRADHLEDVADMPVAHGVGLDHGKGVTACHR
jgi:hypothetical protein